MLLWTGAAFSQTAAQPTAPCSSPEAAQFDFWLGKWELTWSDTGKGTNIITKELGACVIQENFSTTGFSGKSWSVYNQQKKQWEQTWVDNSGAYMLFAGGFAEGKMTLSRSFTGPQGRTIMQRMVFYDITPGKFMWRWEASQDEGKTWKTNWLISYKRAEK